MKVTKTVPDSFYEGRPFEEVGVVKEVIAAVRSRGDDAVREYTKKFDQQDVDSYEVTKEDIKRAYESVDDVVI